MAANETNSIPTIFTPEERIKQLADIDKNITKMLRAAGEAVQALANQNQDGQDQPPSDEAARSAFNTATSRYFSLLSSVDVNIRRQIWALEEANIISAPAEKDGSAPKGKASVDMTALGNLDVAWLNSRNDKVGKEMEAELWEKALSLLVGVGEEGAQPAPIAEA